MLAQVRSRTVRLKRNGSGHGVVQAGPKRIDVGPNVQIISRGLFRRPVVRGTGGDVHLCDRTVLIVRLLGQPQVPQFHGPFLIEHDVFRFDIPVDEIVFLGVLQRPGHLQCDAPGPLLRHRSVLLQNLLQGRPINVFHDKVIHPVFLPDVNALDNVFV